MASQSSSEMRAVVFLGLALVAGSAATMAFYQLMMGYEREIRQAREPERSVLAIVAANDLYPGVPIMEEDVVGIEIPERYVHTDALKDVELVVGRIPRERILANEFILPDRLADGSTGVGLNALVPPGMRAVSLDISNGEALAGLLSPGNIVDVLVTVAGDGRTVESERQTLTMLQTVTVLAVDDRMLTAPSPDAGAKRRGPERSAPSVTVALTPEQAEALTLADHRGDIHLSLRNDIDAITVAEDGTRNCDLVGECFVPPARPAHVPQEPAGNVLEIWRGTQRQDYRTDEKK